jgi:hypothetical protein
MWKVWEKIREQGGKKIKEQRKKEMGKLDVQKAWE